jgi:hypothetical protein
MNVDASSISAPPASPLGIANMPAPLLDIPHHAPAARVPIIRAAGGPHAQASGIWGASAARRMWTAAYGMGNSKRPGERSHERKLSS